MKLRRAPKGKPNRAWPRRRARESTLLCRLGQVAAGEHPGCVDNAGEALLNAG